MIDDRYGTEPDNTVLVDYEDGILTITLNRPDRLNAINKVMATRMASVLEQASRDPTVRVIVITGAGRGFCSGADAEGLATGAESGPEAGRSDYPYFTARQCKIFKPTICAVNGVCAGGGLHFVADSDIVIASERASFLDTHVNIGQISALEPIGLARQIPMSVVLRMVVLGKAERLDAEMALACNLVSEVVPEDKLLKRAHELAQIAANVSPAAVQASLEAIWDSMEMSLSEAYASGFEKILAHRAHADALEGPLAFSEKRAPVWSDKES